ncbi:Universal stress protein [Planctomycetes bacterium Pla163]|jgi:nucleotide-binding universal stress UspA family protein|uniref:Universal stress protein n=1 Tax=Rohdeia mirabilis TaxID=2528008 RepID=A0A518CXE4_9BACT|nr:Universal stress protein [Planctomycetes bacterium Pla163]
MKLKHILLPTDLSDEAQRAFGPVAELARDTGAKVTLIHVVRILVTTPPGAMFAGPLTIGDPHQEKEDANKALAEQAKAMGEGVKVETEVLLDESVGRAIVEFAEQNGVDVIAVSTHGRSGLRRVILGSVAEDILHRSHLPVLAFPPAK